jgi:3-oxoacyl-[acyl-carrier protein] reductase
MGKLDGKVAIVTGAARGLGRAYAKRLAGLGAKVAVADLNLRSYEEFEAEAKDMTADSTVAEIEASGGVALAVEVDVRDHEAVEAMVARVVPEWGRVDVLVANAGGGRGRPMDTKASSLDTALLQLVTEMNLFGTVYSCNAVAPIMKQQRSGKIITVSSVAGTAPSADGGYAHYGAAKAAIAHYTRYLAQDLGPFGITANCIAPGVIATGRIMMISSTTNSWALIATRPKIAGSWMRCSGRSPSSISSAHRPVRYQPIISTFIVGWHAERLRVDLAIGGSSELLFKPLQPLQSVAMPCVASGITQRGRPDYRRRCAISHLPEPRPARCRSHHNGCGRAARTADRVEWLAVNKAPSCGPCVEANQVHRNFASRSGFTHFAAALTEWATPSGLS